MAMWSSGQGLCEYLIFPHKNIHIDLDSELNCEIRWITNESSIRMISQILFQNQIKLSLDTIQCDGLDTNMVIKWQHMRSILSIPFLDLHIQMSVLRLIFAHLIKIDARIIEHIESSHWFLPEFYWYVVRRGVYQYVPKFIYREQGSALFSGSAPPDIIIVCARLGLIPKRLMLNHNQEATWAMIALLKSDPTPHDINENITRYKNDIVYCLLENLIVNRKSTDNRNVKFPDGFFQYLYLKYGVESFKYLYTYAKIGVQMKIQTDHTNKVSIYDNFLSELHDLTTIFRHADEIIQN